MDNQTGTELRLEPGGFWGHDIAGIGNIHELLHRHGVERQSHGHLSGIDAALELAQAAYAAYEVDPLVRAQISDTKDVAEYKIGRYCDVEHTDGVGIVITSFTGRERIPVAVSEI